MRFGDGRHPAIPERRVAREAMHHQDGGRGVPRPQEIIDGAVNRDAFGQTNARHRHPPLVAWPECRARARWSRRAKPWRPVAILSTDIAGADGSPFSLAKKWMWWPPPIDPGQAILSRAHQRRCCSLIISRHIGLMAPSGTPFDQIRYDGRGDSVAPSARRRENATDPHPRPSPGFHALDRTCLIRAPARPRSRAPATRAGALPASAKSPETVSERAAKMPRAKG